MVAFTALPLAKPIKSSPNSKVRVRSLRHWRVWVAAGLILGLISTTPVLPIPTIASVTNAATDIVCSGAGFGPSHGGIWLVKQTIQAQTATGLLDTPLKPSRHYAYTLVSNTPLFQYANPAYSVATEPVYGRHTEPLQTSQPRAPPHIA